MCVCCACIKFLNLNLSYDLLGVRQRGIQSTEKMLREDSIITAIGELSKSKTESNYLILQLPLNGSPFYITSMSITSLMRKLDDHKKIYRHVFSVLGSYYTVFNWNILFIILLSLNLYNLLKHIGYFV